MCEQVPLTNKRDNDIDIYDVLFVSPAKKPYYLFRGNVNKKDFEEDVILMFVR